MVSIDSITSLLVSLKFAVFSVRWNFSLIRAFLHEILLHCKNQGESNECEFKGEQADENV